jgi:tetratricopeptide (TPR) repeat protein
LSIDSDNAKALYLRAIAYKKLKQYDEAVADFKSSIKKNPNDKAIRKEFQACKDDKKAYDKSQQDMYKNLLQR